MTTPWWFTCEGCLRPSPLPRPHCADCGGEAGFCFECFPLHVSRDHAVTQDLRRPRRSSGLLRTSGELSGRIPTDWDTDPFADTNPDPRPSEESDGVPLAVATPEPEELR